MLKSHPIVRVTLWLLLLAFSAGILIFSATLLYLGPKLPPVEQILEIQLQTPLRIYSSEQKLIAEFGEKKRSPLQYSEIPEDFIQAVLAAEDARFFSHHGVDLKGLARASLELISTGSIKTGGSTITMQVAKNYFLTRERTFLRKFNEILLALDIERKLSKEQILQLYVNKIYLGHRAYGIQAAAQVYYGKPVQELSLAQLATIAGLPKAPSAFNPVTNPSRAHTRRNWILSRMLELGYIDKSAKEQAQAEPTTAELHGIPVEVEAPHFAEMVRRDMVARFGEKADTEGYRVYTSLKADFQKAAHEATIKGLIEYDRRHGYRGEEAKLEINPELDTPETLQSQLRKFRTIDILEPGVVTAIEEQSATVLIKSGESVNVPFEGMKWARSYIDNLDRGPAPKKPEDVLEIGDVIRIINEKVEQKDSKTGKVTTVGDWSLAQKPIAQSAMVSIDPHNGAILALIGGFDFQTSKFNRAIQGGRQAGSSFKPFIYSAALDYGMTPATIINDAPVVFKDSSLESTWRPENSGGRFYGPTRLRKALYLSRNLVSIRVLRQMGVKKTIRYATQFGFKASKLPNNLSLALGSAALTPWEIATGYSVLANGGFMIEPWYIDYIEDEAGNRVFESNPVLVCNEQCQQELEYDQLQAQSDSELPVSDQAEPNNTGTAAQPEPPKDKLDAFDEDAPEEATTPEPKPVRYAERVQDERVNFLITSMMQDVVKRGTGTRARSLNRNDIAGKTGTTNDQKDAWFSGFNRDVVATVWVGFDQPKTLGHREYGGTAALPIWIDYMAVALKDYPQSPIRIPDGITTVRIDPETGKRAIPGQANGIFEYFRDENAPEQSAEEEVPNPHMEQGELPEQLF
ncbi:penicillin-binding protein 1A [Ketobacter sp. MCCC 1A13808]|uniref:penicillin-binding protein 1A n=1 Tax=Ketobacter sp. MCCC 1A13808 TaxID=2602738 RepID=UPI000F144DAB|nr:penicillin-binding protein 1A [Ketobacter sp. MCCC 1A13808]MVF13116.1 penicillin-binding protein 1A [Ketobacter sp. MCCC 1A13808]RLP54763.1 MAG: penicillin-binding protein 1A [Ketobacter sp.]